MDSRLRGNDRARQNNGSRGRRPRKVQPSPRKAILESPKSLILYFYTHSSFVPLILDRLTQTLGLCRS